MKLIFFCRDISDCGGIQQTTCNLISRLMEHEEKLEVKVVSLYHKNKSCFFEIAEEAELHTLFDNFINLHFAENRIRKKLNEFLSHEDFDFLIVQGCEYANYIPDKFWEKNVIVCEHEYFGFGHYQGIHYRGVRKALKKASAIVTVTGLDANDFKNKAKRDIPIISIYNSLCANNADTLVNYNLSSKTIVSCGSLVKLKGFDRAILIAKDVLNKHLDWKWEIYGDGVLRDELELLIDKNNLNGKVILKGYETDKKVIYGDKAFLVVTSDFEGFGMVLIEAMQYKLPIVSFDIKYGPKEIVEDGFTGKLIEAFNIKKMSDYLDKFIEDNTLREKFSNNTTVSITRFEATEIVGKWMSLFSLIINRNMEEK